MKKLLMIGLLLITKAFAAESTIKFRDLRAIKEAVTVNEIVFQGFLSGEEAMLLSGSSNTMTIKLQLKGTTGCGKEFLLGSSNDMVKISEIGYVGPSMQPACFETFEYFWTPQPFELEKNETKVITSKIFSDLSYPDSFDEAPVEKFFTLSVEVTKKIGEFPGGMGYGVFYEYKNLKIQEPTE